MTGQKKFLRDLKLAPNAGYVTYGNNSNSQIRGYDILTNGNLSISNVAYVADLKNYSISVAQLTDSNHRVKFCKKQSYVMTEDRSECLIKSNGNKNMYPLNINMIIGKPQLYLLSKFVLGVSLLWHRRLAHLNFWYMNDLVFGEMIRGLPLIKFENDHLCPACECGKQSKKGHPVIIEKSILEPLEILHNDLCGPSIVESLHKKNTFL